MNYTPTLANFSILAASREGKRGRKKFGRSEKSWGGGGGGGGVENSLQRPCCEGFLLPDPGKGTRKRTFEDKKQVPLYLRPKLIRSLGFQHSSRPGKTARWRRIAGHGSGVLTVLINLLNLRGYCDVFRARQRVSHKHANTRFAMGFALKGYIWGCLLRGPLLNDVRLFLFTFLIFFKWSVLGNWIIMNLS